MRHDESLHCILQDHGLGMGPMVYEDWQKLSSTRPQYIWSIGSLLQGRAIVCIHVTLTHPVAL